MSKVQPKIFMGDFETTVFEGQTSTEVWSSALVEMYTEDVLVHHSILETWNFLLSLKQNVIVYYHNLKFDGTFWIYFFLVTMRYEQALIKNPDDSVMWQPKNKMNSKTFRYAISDMGQFYNIIVKVGDNYIEFRDSLKLLPFNLRKLCKDFNTKHQKLDMVYKGYRYSGCDITKEEEEYIKNDVLGAKEALEIMFDEGHKKLTIGACCLGEYKEIWKKSLHPVIIGFRNFEEMFPDIRNTPLDETLYGSKNAEEYIRKSYGGGWCYVVPEKANKVITKGLTADVNSLYPSVMHSKSGSKYPFGKPHFWKGNYIPEEAKGDNKYYFVRFRTRFRIKKNYLPFIQIKGTYLYKGTECLITSDIYNPKYGKYSPEYTLFGKTEKAIPTLTKTCTDFELIKEHYNLFDLEILDGCWFYAVEGIFDEYINKYAEIKMNSKGSKRQLAKWFLNNLYGKFATSDESSFKVAYIKDNGAIGYYIQREHNKDVVYIPIGSAITSYARNFTIRTAQKNYYGSDKSGFIYADTDSIHCDLESGQLVDVPVHPTEFCHWKLESFWDKGIFARQKTYIEHVTHDDCEPVKPYYNIKCAGMGGRCKELLNLSLEGTQEYNEEKYTKDELIFLFDENKEPIKRELTDFKSGLIVPSKLLPRNIVGGILLTETTFEMR